MSERDDDMLPCLTTIHLPGDTSGLDARKAFMRERWPSAVFRVVTRRDGHVALFVWVKRADAIARREKNAAFNREHKLPPARLHGVIIDNNYETFPAHPAPQSDEEVSEEFAFPVEAK